MEAFDFVWLWLIYAQETNRLNHKRRSSAESTRHELAEAAKAIAKIVRVIEQAGSHRALSDRPSSSQTGQFHRR
jgi:hypothetical protein